MPLTDAQKRQWYVDMARTHEQLLKEFRQPRPTTTTMAPRIPVRQQPRTTMVRRTQAEIQRRQENHRRQQAHQLRVAQEQAAIKILAKAATFPQRSGDEARRLAAIQRQRDAHLKKVQNQLQRKAQLKNVQNRLQREARLKQARNQRRREENAEKRRQQQSQPRRTNNVYTPPVDWQKTLRR